MSNSKGIGTGGIIAIVLGSVAVVGGVLWLILKPKKEAKAVGSPNKNTMPPKPNNGKTSLTSTPINNNTAEKSILDQLSKLLNKKDSSGGASKGGGIGSGGGGGKMAQSSNKNTEWKQDKDGYWKDPTDGRMYWENEDGSMTDKETGDMYDSKTGEWLGIDYGDGSYSDPDGNLYIYNEETGEWDKGGYAYDDGSWSDADGVLYDESGNEIGYVYDDGSWSDENGILYDENDNEIGQVYNDGTWMDSEGDIWDSETGEQVYFDDSWMNEDDEEDLNVDEDWMDATGKRNNCNSANSFYK